MSSLAESPQITGFFSYSREDDEAYKGRLSALREAIQQELGAQLGLSRSSFRLWQDKEAVAPGKLWEAEIQAAVEQSVFFIPIVTPRAINSVYCKFEFEAFLARECALGRADLVFPILYVPVPALLNKAQWRNNPVLSTIAKRQYVDWQTFRYSDVQSSATLEAVARFCRNIVEALHETWLSPEERRKQEEAVAQARIDEDRRNQETEAEAKRRAEAEARRNEKEAEAQRAAEERRKQEEAVAQARINEDRRNQEAEAKRRAEAAARPWREGETQASRDERRHQAETDAQQWTDEAPRRGAKGESRLVKIDQLITEFFQPIKTRLEKDNAIWRRIIRDKSKADSLQYKMAAVVEREHVIPNHEEIISIIEKWRHLVDDDKELSSILNAYLDHVIVFKSIRAAGDDWTYPELMGSPWPKNLYSVIGGRLTALVAERDALASSR
jgi:hypothetical protein